MKSKVLNILKYTIQKTIQKRSIHAFIDKQTSDLFKPAEMHLI